jgi:hypothetical protein
MPTEAMNERNSRCPGPAFSGMRSARMRAGMPWGIRPMLADDCEREFIREPAIEQAPRPPDVFAARAVPGIHRAAGRDAPSFTATRPMNRKYVP